MIVLIRSFRVIWHIYFLRSFGRKGEIGDLGYSGPPGRQGAEGEKGAYIPELDEIIMGSIGIQGEPGELGFKLISSQFWISRYY